MNAPDRRCSPAAPRGRSTPRALLAALTLSGLVGLLLLVSACGGPAGPRVVTLGTTTTSATTAASTPATSARARDLAFARCMRSHGVPSFPDPDPQGDFPPFSTGVSKQTSVAANETCKNLLPSGGGSSAGTREAGRQKLAFALTVARCMRSHGFPTYPDPGAPSSASQGGGTSFDGTGIDPRSPHFQLVETSCEKHARQVLGLP